MPHSSGVHGPGPPDAGDPERTLTAIAEGLLAPLDAVLARVWLVGPGDACSTCAMRSECPDQSRCLHLLASAGVTRRIDGPFRRFPIGARAVGQVALTLEPFVARERFAALGLAEDAWISTHRIRSFAAWPLEAGGELLGVLAVFSRQALSDDDARLLGIAARHAALAIALARGAPPPASSQLRTLADLEREAIERVLAHTGGRISGPQGAAAILGLKPTTLDSRIKKLGVRKPPRGPARSTSN